MPRQKRGKRSGNSCLPEGIPTGFDVIGDIAVVNIPAEYEDYYSEVAAYIAGKRKNVRTVLNRTASAGGDFRVPCFEVIYGDPRTVTVHRESGLSYMVDLKDSFFNPRLCTERMRVAAMVNGNEIVLVPFAGVGPFAILPAKRGANVYAVEMNPAACGWLRKNMELNDASGSLEIIRGDAHDIPDIFSTEFDRAIVPAPYGFEESLILSASCVKKGGFIHFYTFKRPSEIDGLRESYERSGFETVSVRRCGNVAKGVARWAFDLRKI
ncbi:class I SAM-dependent methyltransferase [Methanolacinia petrolearia]|uniref:class I SAM-dependent methyltransferase n=1 Tax=Methanolacinia petrolearia TaxID=54120 RepID=UPI003BA9007A